MFMYYTNLKDHFICMTQILKTTLFKDYQSIMVKTLKKFWKNYKEEDSKIGVNNIGPQVMC